MNFIDEIASYVQKYAQLYGIKVHSPIIAQAILESAKGTSELAVNANNFFGLKYNLAQPYRCPTATGYYVKKGSEQNADGTYTSSTMLWQKFDSIEDCVIGYFDFINNSRYANLKGVTDPKTYLENIKEDGYATSLKYVENLMNVIEQYNLTKYDNAESGTVMKTVFLSAGHGGSNAGAVAYGLKEKDINLITLLSCQMVLERHGVKVVCSRTKDENDDVYEEVKEANASGCEIAVSFHANAGGGDGFEVFYYSTSAKGKKLAQLGEKYVKELGQNSRGVKTGDHLYFVRKTNMPAVLFESFFLDNDKDNDIGDTVEEQKAFGVAYAKAILEYLGIKYTNTPTSTNTPVNEPITKPQTQDKLYRVQCGSFKEKKNAEALKDALKYAGFEAIIVEAQ